MSRKFYVMTFENGVERYGEFYDYIDALNYAESLGERYGEFTLSEYDSEEDYYENI